MPLDLKAIIADKTKFPDTYVVQVGDDRITLGDLRALDADQRKALEDRDKALQARQAELMNSLTELRAAQTRVAEMYADLQAKGSAAAAAAANPAAAVDPFADLAKAETDPFLQPLVKAIRQLASSTGNKEVNDALNAIRESQKQMAVGYVRDKLDDMYERLNLDDAKQAEFPLDKLVQYASTQGLRTGTGIPDIRKAFKQMTAAQTEAEKLAKARDEGIAEGLRKAAEKQEQSRIVVPRPGGFSTVPPATPAGQRPKTLDEAVAAAMQDADIWKIIDGQAAS